MTRPHKTILAAAMLAAVSALGGCAMAVADMDVDAAIAQAAMINVENVKTVTADKAAAHDRAAAKLEDELTKRISASRGGAAAAAILAGYRTMRARQAAARSADLAQYAEMVDNAMLISELVDRRIAVRARWRTLMDRYPPISRLRSYAEVEARRYVETLGRDHALPMAETPGER